MAQDPPGDDERVPGHAEREDDEEHHDPHREADRDPEAPVGSVRSLPSRRFFQINTGVDAAGPGPDPDTSRKLVRL
ncbi:hypothetical protein GCM10020295_55020 [Streptomyces cinereospinus]